jgi:hypothetical protein
MSNVTRGALPRHPTALARSGATVLVLVVAANLFLRTVAVAVDGSLASFQPLGYPAVLGASAVATVGAVAVYALLDRLTDRPNRPFAVVALAVLVVSLFPVVFVAPSIDGATTTALVALGGMHVLTATAVVLVLVARDDPLVDWR